MNPTSRRGSDLPSRYRYTYHLHLRFGTNWGHRYVLVGCWGAVEFHVVDVANADESKGHSRWSAGLEYHFRQPMDSCGHTGKPPTHDQCSILNCPCWCDGTSLHAHEHLLPIWLALMANHDHEGMFRVLVGEADRAFAELQEATGKAVAP